MTDRRTLANYGIATLMGAGTTLCAVGLLLPAVTPDPITVQPCTEDGVTLFDGSCGHPDVDSFHDGYWWPANVTDNQSGLIAPLRLGKGDKQ